MDFNGIKEIIEEINESNIAYFEYETVDGHIKIDKSLSRNINSNEEKKVDRVEENKQVVVEDDNDIIVDKVVSNNSVKTINSPMVGTFYKASSPDDEPFVKSGDIVNKGAILCIIEAMKLMNEIEAEDNCEIVKVLVNDGDMVEYGQPLFEIKECI